MNNNEISNKLKVDYGIQIDEFQSLGDNENVVLKGINNLETYAIRITSISHRSEKEIFTELNLINMLSETGCVVKIITNNQGDLYDILNLSGESYFLSIFNFQEGLEINKDSEHWNSNTFKKRGVSMGKIHKVTSKYNSELDSSSRLDRDQEIIIDQASYLLEGCDQNELVLQKLKNVINKLQGFSKNVTNFGLTHTDMRPRNFQYHNGELIHFDFDDICNHWFVYDIAVSAYHAIEYYGSKKVRTEFGILFIKDLLDGYNTSKSLTNEELDYIIDLMKLRCIYAYIDYFKRLKIKNKNSGFTTMQKRLGYIKNFETFIDTKKVGDFILRFQKNG